QVDRIGQAFGDVDGRHVSVWDLAPGSVVVRWYNTSFSSSMPCPSDDLHTLHDLMLTPQGAVRAEFADHFLPEFEVVSGDITPGGACLSPDTPQHQPPPDLGTED
ncbi:Dystroglycan, partial [Trinorchestia longiramus]